MSWPSSARASPPIAASRQPPRGAGARLFSALFVTTLFAELIMARPPLADTVAGGPCWDIEAAFGGRLLVPARLLMGSLRGQTHRPDKLGAML